MFHVKQGFLADSAGLGLVMAGNEGLGTAEGFDITGLFLWIVPT